MKQDVSFKHEFVESLPEVLKERTLYVCMEFATVSHRCACGCGHEVVTPLSPTDWKLIFDGRKVTLYPSIGNWGFKCRSHYWIRSNRVQWAPSWSDDEIASGRTHDRFVKDRYFDSFDGGAEAVRATSSEEMNLERSKVNTGLWQQIRKWWKS